MFYDKYAELCAYHNIKPTTAATRMGLSDSTPVRWKRDKAFPKLEILEKVAQFFNVPITYFFPDDAVNSQAYPEARSEYELLLQRPELREIFEMLKGCDVTELQRIRETIALCLNRK